MQGNNFDDDIDDIMASIMSGQKPAPQAHVRKTPRQKIKQRPELRPISESKLPSPVGNSYPAPKPKQPKAKKNYKKAVKPLLSLACLTIVIAGGTVLWRGPVADMLKPKSPFSEEISQSVNAPLYFPTKMPGTFKLELNSITRPEPEVVVYAITDDEGRQINVSMQKQPRNITLDPLHQSLSDIRELNTKFGTIKTGTSEDGVEITNILTGDTWIILTSKTGSVSIEEIEPIIQSLET